MKVEDIKIDDIEIIENIRVNEKDLKLAELMDSIKQNGLEQPIGVSKAKTGKYVIVYGTRRLAACKKMGWKTIPCVITEEDIELKELLVLNAIENLQRKDITPMELGRVVERFKELDMTDQEIASRLSITQNQIKAANQVYKHLPSKIRNRITFLSRGKDRKGKIPASVMTMLLTMRRKYKINDTALNKIADEVRMEELTAQDLFVVSCLIDQGLTIAQGLKECKAYKAYTVSAIIKKEDMETVMENSGISSGQVFSEIIYGDLKPFKRPHFMTSHQAKK